MGRFYTSKYKNAAPKRPKKEQSVFGIRVNELCPNDPVACGVDKVVFAAEGAGIGLLDHDEVGNLPTHRTLHGHSEFVKSLEFNPFKHDLLCTCAADGLIKLWDTTLLSCSATLHASNPHINMTRFHPVAGNILASAEQACVCVYDLNKESKSLEQQLDSNQVSWSYDGRLLCSSSRSGEISICDPRAKKVVASVQVFDANKDINHVWVGVDKLLLCGMKNRHRYLQTVDIANLGAIIKSEDLGAGSGSPHVQYDHDTGMIFQYSRGDTAWNYYEVKAGDSEMTVTKNWTENAEGPIKGIALAPKSILDVMSGEVNRLIILQSTSIQPTPYIVPRKSYHEFHHDLFPDTRGPVPGVDAEGWLGGEDGYRELISLNPASKPVHPQDEDSAEVEMSAAVSAPEPVPVVEENAKHVQIVNHLTEGHSIYKNIEGKVAHKQYHFHNLKNVQSVHPQESNGFQVGEKYIAHLMVGTGGRIGIIDLATPGQNNTEQYELVNSATPICFEWDPFSKGDVLAVGGDDALVKLWKINDIKSSTLIKTFEKHSSKVMLLRYHPAISGLLATCDFSGTLCLWDTHNLSLIKVLCDSPADNVAMCWDVADGYILYTVDKTGIITIYNTKLGSKQQISLNTDIRSARMESTRSLVVISTLGASNSRHMYLLSPDNTSLTLLASHSLGSGTSLYSPFIDMDTNVGYFAARGETNILPFELRTAPPHYIIPCSPFTSLPAQYALSPLNKLTCDVMQIEIAKFYKLYKDVIHLIIFSLPRVRKEYFQDDIFPAVSDLTSPVLDVQQYLEKAEYTIKLVDLCPEGVQRNSEVEIVRTGSHVSKVQQDHLKYKSAEAQRDELFNAFAEQVQKDAGPLEQDLMDGCEDDEWSD